MAGVRPLPGRSGYGRIGRVSAPDAGSRFFRPQTTWPTSAQSGSDPSHGLLSRGSKGDLTTRETRFALRDEGLHALLLVLGREEHGEEGRLLGERRLVRALEREIDRLLRGRESERALR